MTGAFRAKWNEVVKREGDRFTNNEREFIYDTHYAPLVQQIKEKTGLDVEARGEALRNVAWSIAVQHGNPKLDPKAIGLEVFEAALKKWTREQLATRRGTTGSVSDEFLIAALYDERGRRKENGNMYYFPDNDQATRFKSERSDAQRTRALEPLAPDPPDLNKTDLGKLAKGIGIIAGPVRKPNPNLFVDRGQPTFDYSGYDKDFSTTRKPAVPNVHSGIRLGRGYDLGRVSKAQAEKDLKGAGLSETQVQVYAGGAGLTGDKARAYLDGFNYSRLSGEATKLGLKGPELNKHITERMPQTITHEQQKKLFETGYARAGEEAKEQFPGFEKFPAPAQTALLDMIFDRGTATLARERPGFVDAVRDRKWDEAAILSKRNGAGYQRNTWTRDLLEQLVAPPPKPKVK